MKEFLNNILNISIIQISFVFIAVFIIVYLPRVFYPHFIFLYKNPFLIWENDVWFLCKTNLARQ